MRSDLSVPADTILRFHSAHESTDWSSPNQSKMASHVKSKDIPIISFNRVVSFNEEVRCMSRINRDREEDAFQEWSSVILLKDEFLKQL